VPVNAYIIQGAFADAANDGNLLSYDSALVNAPNSNSAGATYAVNVDTHVRVNLLINDGVNHVKRIEVVRPGGNAVVFNFPWDATANAFSRIGTPMSWNNRESTKTYVLQDVSPSTDESSEALPAPFGSLHSYSLFFDSG
jgi:hypothetical protein